MFQSASPRCVTQALTRWGLTLLVIGGCATRYRYATGQQAELLTLASSPAWLAWHPLTETVTGARTTEAGVAYEFITGQTPAAVQVQCGQPTSVLQSQRDAGTELWEYPFGLVRFKRGRLTDVTFNPHASGTSYYEHRWFIRWP